MPVTEVGRTITAPQPFLLADGTSSPNISYEYQWLRFGVPIEGATNPTYTTQELDGGPAKLQVRITGLAPRHAKTTVTSDFVFVGQT